MAESTFDFGKLLDGLGGMWQNKQTGDLNQQAALDLSPYTNAMNTQIQNLSGMYGQDSPYAKTMRQELDRRDAAAGRLSQYGPREVELQAALAKQAPVATQAITNAADIGSKIQKNIFDYNLDYNLGQQTQMNDAMYTASQLGRDSGLTSALGSGLSSLFGGSGSSSLGGLASSAGNSLLKLLGGISGGGGATEGPLDYGDAGLGSYSPGFGGTYYDSSAPVFNTGIDYGFSNTMGSDPWGFNSAPSYEQPSTDFWGGSNDFWGDASSYGGGY